MTASGSHGPELRIADSDREAAVTALGEHYAAGRLTKEEFEERAAAAWAARTASGLWPLFADLPRVAVPGAVAPAVAEPVRRRTSPPLPTVLLVVLVLLVLTKGMVLVPLLLWALWTRSPRHRRHGMPSTHGGHGAYDVPHRFR
jgi:hypothetical protein